MNKKLTEIKKNLSKGTLVEMRLSFYDDKFDISIITDKEEFECEEYPFYEEYLSSKNEGKMMDIIRSIYPEVNNIYAYCPYMTSAKNEYDNGFRRVKAYDEKSGAYENDCRYIFSVKKLEHINTKVDGVDNIEIF